MLIRYGFLTLLAATSSSIKAQLIFDEPRLEAFVNDMQDNTKARHYKLSSKQLAIHKWSVRDCMLNLGYESEYETSATDWQAALYGKYAYCQDHHIPGVDPPCPGEAVVASSINNSCYQISYDKIDWSFNILHSAERYLIDQWSLDNSDTVIQTIENEWSTCMREKGLHYETRIAMYSSFADARASASSVNVPKTDESVILQEAQRCFTSTGYYQKRKEHADSVSAEQLHKNRTNINLLLDRYEAAESHAVDTIENYCKIDRGLIVQLYEEEKYVDASICEYWSEQ